MFASDYVKAIRDDYTLNAETIKKLIESSLDSALNNGILDLNYLDEFMYTHLMAAVEVDDFITTQWLLNKGVDINQRDALGQTALHIAARNPHDFTDMLKLLLQYNADPGKEVIYDSPYTPIGHIFTKETPIMSAARYGNINIFKILFDLQFPIEGYSPSLLHVLNTVKKIFTLLQSETATVRRFCFNYRNVNYETFNKISKLKMHRMSHIIEYNRNNPFLIKYLGESTVNIEELKQILEYHPEILQHVHERSNYRFWRIIEFNRDPFLIKYLGESTVTIGKLKKILKYHPEILPRVRKRFKSRFKPLTEYLTDYVEHIRNNHQFNAETKKNLIEGSLDSALINGTIDLNYLNELKYTQLMKAVEKNDLITTQWLLNKGVDINQRDALGQTALHIAARNQHDSTDMLKLLLQYGADPEKEVIYYSTYTPIGRIFAKELPIMSAARYGNINIFKILFDLQFAREGYSPSLWHVLNTVEKIFTLLQSETETVRKVCFNYRNVDDKTLNRISEYEMDKVWSIIESNRDPFLIKYLGASTVNIEELKQILEYHLEYYPEILKFDHKRSRSSIENLSEDEVVSKRSNIKYKY